MQQLKYKDLVSNVLKFRPHVNVSPKYMGNLDFDVKLSNGKALQRELVWTPLQKSEFIKSIIKGNYIPPIYIIKKWEENINNSIDYVIDGKQRLSTFIAFSNGDIPIIIDSHEYFYSDLDSELQSIINRYDFNVCYFYTDKNITDDILINTFEFLNFSGTPQDIEHIQKLKSTNL